MTFTVGTIPHPAGLTERRCIMLWTLAVVLLVLWLLGLITSYTFGGLLHMLLVIALVVVIVRLFQGRGVSA